MNKHFVSGSQIGFQILKIFILFFYNDYSISKKQQIMYW